MCLCRALPACQAYQLPPNAQQKHTTSGAHMVFLRPLWKTLFILAKCLGEQMLSILPAFVLEKNGEGGYRPFSEIEIPCSIQLSYRRFSGRESSATGGAPQRTRRGRGRRLAPAALRRYNAPP